MEKDEYEGIKIYRNEVNDDDLQTIKNNRLIIKKLLLTKSIKNC